MRDLITVAHRGDAKVDAKPCGVSISIRGNECLSGRRGGCHEPDGSSGNSPKILGTEEGGEDPIGFRNVQGKAVSARGRCEQDGPQLDRDRCFIGTRLQTICGSMVIVASREHRRVECIPIGHICVKSNHGLLVEGFQTSFCGRSREKSYHLKNKR
ncbi:Uncharacterized protein TCM_012666 [Theobroma cacao]|uniref:Uncharacterized protein n=1 Tax=Theobroma cacao TaxID=3641 RepID=A0A061FW04_THECC|nr:Uncharacterized protein TCM_012666 [Theobroma cacao]